MLMVTNIIALKVLGMCQTNRCNCKTLLNFGMQYMIEMPEMPALHSFKQFKLRFQESKNE